MAKDQTGNMGYDQLVKWGDSTWLACRDAQIQETREYFDGSELSTGDRYVQAGRRVVTKIDVAGNVAFNPSYAEAKTLADTFANGTEGEGAGDWSGWDSHTISTASESRTVTVIVDHEIQAYTYASCYIEAMTWKCGENQPLEMSFELLGTTEVAAASSQGSPTLGAPVMFDDMTITLGGSSYPLLSFEATFKENFVSRFVMSQTRTGVIPGRMDVTFSCELDYNADTLADLFAERSGASDVEVIVKAESGSYGIGFELPECKVTSPTPTVAGADEFKPTLDLRAYKPAAADLFTVYSKTPA